MKRYFSICINIALVLLISTSLVIVAEAKEWVELSPMQTNRNEMGVICLNDRIYVIGGSNGQAVLATVEEYDISNNTWKYKASMPEVKRSFGIVMWNELIFTFGGSGTGDKVDVYDPLSDSWSSRSNMLTPRERAGAVEVNGKIYVIGGKRNNKIIDTVEEYDPINDTWTTKSSIKKPRYSFGIAEHRGKIYIFGGYSSAGGIISDVEEYDPETDTWTVKANMPSKKNFLGATTLNNNIYIVGGFQQGLGVVGTVDVYNPIENTWSTIKSLPLGRKQIGVTEAEGKLYVFGGTTSNNSTVNNVEVFGLLGSPDKISIPVDLTASPNINNIVLDWNEVDEADSYMIFRSTTSGVIETVIATGITETSYVDIDVEPGITYYYVVRAIKGDTESENSNIASAMLEVNYNRAVLQVKMSTTDIYEYRVTMDKVDKFITWYIDRSNGEHNKPFYKFHNDNNIEPYTDVNEYLMFEKIVWFKVKEYIDK